MNMLSMLASGLALWVVYGVLQKDIVIILADAISLVLISGLAWLKLLLDIQRKPRRPAQAERHPAKGYELCFCCRVILKRGPANSEANSDEHGNLPISRI